MADPAIVAQLLLEHCDLMMIDELPIAMPDVAFEAPSDGKYLRVDLFTNAPFWQGLASGRMDQGLLQITVVWPKGEGLIQQRRVVGAVQSYFPKGLRLAGPGVRVRVNREPWGASPILDDGETLTPITIPWIAS